MFAWKKWSFVWFLWSAVGFEQYISKNIVLKKYFSFSFLKKTKKISGPLVSLASQLSPIQNSHRPLLRSWRWTKERVGATQLMRLWPTGL